MTAKAFTSPIHTADQISSNLRPGFIDWGLPWDIASAQDRARVISEKIYALDALTLKEELAITDGSDPVGAAKVKNLLESIYSPANASSSYDGILAMWKSDAGHGPDFNGFTYHYEIQQWQGVLINGNKATVQFVGGVEVSARDLTQYEPPTQWVYWLERANASSDWKLVDRKGVDYFVGRY